MKLFALLRNLFVGSCALALVSCGGGGDSTVDDDRVPSSLQDLQLTITSITGSEVRLTFASDDTSGELLQDFGTFVYENSSLNDEFADAVQSGIYDYRVLGPQLAAITITDGISTGTNPAPANNFFFADAGAGTIETTRIILNFSSVNSFGIIGAEVTLENTNGSQDFLATTSVAGNPLPVRYNGVFTQAPVTPVFSALLPSGLDLRTINTSRTVMVDDGMGNMVAQQETSVVSFRSLNSTTFSEFGTMQVPSLTDPARSLNAQFYTYVPNDTGLPRAVFTFDSDRGSTSTVTLVFDSATSGRFEDATNSIFDGATFTIN